jgi:aryl-alcohol dehydrogenase-like predicted oxidoreductase
MSAHLDDPELRPVLEAADALRMHAEKLDTTAAALAIAFALAKERVATVLFGATTSEQVAENVRAIELLDRLTPTQLEEVRAIARSG